MRNILPKSLFYILASCKWKLKDNYLLCLLNFLSLYIYLPKSNVLDLARCQVLLFFPLVLVYYFLLSSSQQLSIANSSSVGHRTSWPFPGFFFLCWSFVWLELVRVLCMVSQPLWMWAHTYVQMPFYFRKTWLSCLPLLDFKIVLPCLLQ